MLIDYLGLGGCDFRSKRLLERQNTLHRRKQLNKVQATTTSGHDYGVLPPQLRLLFRLRLLQNQCRQRREGAQIFWLQPRGGLDVDYKKATLVVRLLGVGATAESVDATQLHNPRKGKRHI